MTMSSWFRSDGDEKPSVRDSLRYLYPKSAHQVQQIDERSRFSQLTLEHGEKHLQDWAIVAYSSPCTETDIANPSSTRRSNKIHWEQSPLKKRSTAVQHVKKTTQQHNNPVIRDKNSFPTAHMKNIEGRLHLCSRSLVFEPNDTSRAIIRCPFARMDHSPREFPSDTGYEAMCVEFTAKRHLSMKANNVIGPFEPISFPTRFRFTFLHSSPTSFVDLCEKLFEKASHSKGRAAYTTPELDALLKPMLDRPFDPDNLVDVREQVLTSSLRCSLLTPLESKSGVLVLTGDRVYFQPASGVLSATNTRAMRWDMRDVAATARRYNGLRDNALEIYWKDETSMLLGFERRHEREQVMRQLPAHVPCFTDRDFVVQVVKEWQSGTISNFDYLLALNSAAGRSFHDLSRYPVFPWVVADYESSKLDLTKETTFRDLTKPVGALDEKRLEYFRNRLLGMQDMGEDFLYGTHYSAPGYVLYFLVRSMPEHMLCLQNGKFDTPDRLFHSVQQTYRCVLQNHADVKELIPEFYDAGNDFDFLINARGLQLGATQNGDRVNDIKLPPWARSARDFVKKNRKALESDICTRMLPRWIDLIFGVLSRGEAAKEASNLFHRTAYLGPTDLASMKSEDERFQAELQATEFGIVPDMLFVGQHPGKNDAPNEDFVSLDLGRASSKEDSSREAWELLDAPTDPGPNDDFSQSFLTRSNENPELEDTTLAKESNAASQDRYGSAFSSSFDQLSGVSNAVSPSRLGAEEENGPETDPASPLIRSGNPIPSPLDSQNVQHVPGNTATSEWTMSVIEKERIHNDAVSACVLLLHETQPRMSVLATTSLDGGLKIHNLEVGSSTPRTNKDQGGFQASLSRFSYNTIMNRGQAAQAATKSKLTEFRSHSSNDPLASLVLALDGAGGSIAFAGGHDDVVLAYGVNSGCAVASVYSHRDAVTGLDLIARSPFDTGNALWLDNSTHVMISGSWDATVKIWSASVSSGETVSVSREPLAELFDADASIVCVSAKSIPTGGIVIGAGCADGSFCVWNVHSDGVQVVIHNEPAIRGAGPCSVVQWVSVGGSLHMFAGFSTGRIASYTLVDGSRLERKNAVSIGAAVLSLVYSDGLLLVGCADGGLRVITIQDGFNFGAKPTLWNSILDSSSPGISCISVAYGGDEKRKENKYICCAGGEDGSVALFELSRVTAMKAD